MTFDVQIRDMEEKDIDFVCILLRNVITETYRINKVGNDDLLDFIKEKQEGIKKFIGNDINTGIYKCAVCDNNIVGIGGIYPLCKDMLSNIEDKYKNDLEIGSLYIDVKYQKIGIGKMLMSELVKELEKINKEHFFLDCGYKSSQIYWEILLGSPYKKFRSYFAENEHYLIWKVNVEKARKIFISKDQ